MKETGMLFNAEMVRALLDGRKTQTRRIVKGQEFWGDAAINARPIDGGLWRIEGATQINPKLHDNSVTFVDVKSPFGQVGDRIWVRETFADIGVRLSYRADKDDGAHCKVKRWVPSLHMPRAASRITLEITDVRIERLHDISEEDAAAEGASPIECDHIRHSCEEIGCYGDTAKAAFRGIWESTGGDWKANPWVWVIEFKQIKTGATA